MAVNEAVDLTANGITKRAVTSSGRSISSMPGEAIPYAGIAVLVGVTTLELKDLCDTIKDMNELQRAFNPELRPSADEKTVCGLEPPTVEELWEKAKASPGQVWAAAKEVTPSLDNLKSYEIPDIDWVGTWNTSVAGAGNALTATLDGAGAALEATGGWIDSATEYWAGDDDNDKAD